jgi:tetratricopeptide (TPR) repeat protein
MNDVGLGRDLYRWSKRFGAALIGVSLFVMAQHPLAGLVVAAGGALCFPAGRLAWWVGWRRHTRRLAAISTSPERAGEAIQMYEDLRDVGLPQWPSPIVTSAWLLTEESFQAAYDRLIAVDSSGLPDKVRAVVLNNRALALAHLGRAEEALPLATEALSLTDPSQRPYVLCTLGTAYVKAGRALEGVPFLSESASLEVDSAWSLAVRLRSLGDGLDAVGRVADARSAYRRAIDAAPGTRPAALAEERLAALDARA